METMLLEHGEVKRFEKHLQRLKGSAEFFGFKYKESAIREALFCKLRNFGDGRHCVRLILHPEGALDLQLKPLLSLGDRPSVVLAAERTATNDPLLCHKTTARKLFDDTLAGLQTEPEIFDAVFLNEKNELT